MMATEPLPSQHARGTWNRTSDSHSLPPLMPMGQFLFEYLDRCDIRHSFGLSQMCRFRTGRSPRHCPYNS
jgi:hypothetical protein